MEEQSLREEHPMLVDKLVGLVRAAFPHDRARPDAVFADVDDGGGAGEEGNGAVPASGTGPAGTPGKP